MLKAINIFVIADKIGEKYNYKLTKIIRFPQFI